MIDTLLPDLSGVLYDSAEAIPGVLEAVRRD